MTCFQIQHKTGKSFTTAKAPKQEKSRAGWTNLARSEP